MKSLYLFILRSFLFCLVLMLSNAGYMQHSTRVNDWENPAVFEKNQNISHTLLIPIDQRESCRNDNYHASTYFLDLNGKWDFYWSIVPQVISPLKEQDEIHWNTIHVPGNWQMQGYGRAHFRNHFHAIPNNPPFIPDNYNPVGLYKRKFILPEAWEGRRVFIRLNGVKSAFYIYINGREIGYNEDSMSAAEFDITDYLVPDQNSVLVQVFRFSDGTYLECQDMVRLSGIYRDVFLYSKPVVHIQDLVVQTTLDENYKHAELKVKADIRNSSSNHFEDGTLNIQLYDSSGKSVIRTSLKKNITRIEKSSSNGYEIIKTVDNPALWSAEKPVLYTLRAILSDKDGNVLEVVEELVGFRVLEIKDRVIRVNGQNVKFNGINWIPHNPVSGKALTLEQVESEFRLLKQLNINTIRTAHYPPDPAVLELTDQYGLYVVCEANIESHANYHLSENHQWKDAFIHRSQRMVTQHKNHPSIIIWSVGNEAGEGQNLADAVQVGKDIDPTRPWLYGLNKDGRQYFEDIIGPRYPNSKILESIACEPPHIDNRPSFMDEYAHSYGNGLGGFDELWNIIHDYERLSGGTLWDWKNQGVRTQLIELKDLSGHENHGALLGGATIVQGSQRKELYLSGHDDWVTFYRGKSLEPGNFDKITLTMLVKPGLWLGPAPYFSLGDYQVALMQTAEDSLAFLYGDGIVQTAVIEQWEDQWHHIAGIYDGNQMLLYIDGKLRKSKQIAGKLSPTYIPPNIGRDVSEPKSFINASITDIHLFNHNLDEKAIQYDMQHKNSDLKSQAVLWLNSDSVRVNEKYFFEYGVFPEPNASDGIVFSDGELQPEAWQIKKSPQPIRIQPKELNSNQFIIENRFGFTDLNNFRAEWLISAADSIIERGDVYLPLPPGRDTAIVIPYDQNHWKGDEEKILTIRFLLTEANEWAEKNHEIAWEQFVLNNANHDGYDKKINNKHMRVYEENDFITFTADNFKYVFNCSSGRFDSLIYGGRPLLHSGPMINFWRAPTLNDERQMANTWRNTGLHEMKQRVINVKTDTHSNSAAVLNVEAVLEPESGESTFRIFYNYHIFDDGEIQVEIETESENHKPEFIPRVGVTMRLIDTDPTIRWYGRGPHETYPDRKSSAKIGIYESTVNREYVPYIVPGDYGNHTDVRWVEIMNNNGTGFEVTGENLFNMSVQNYSADNLHRAMYTYQLTPQKHAVLNVDHRMSGVGTKFNYVSDKFLVKNKNYSFVLRIVPL